ncbi:MAG: alpha/beta hydrolase [Candidatus Heimdallarchaeota archaeon]
MWQKKGTIIVGVLLSLIVLMSGTNVAFACSGGLARETYTVTVDSPVYVNVQHIYKPHAPSCGAVVMVHGGWHTSFFYHFDDYSKYSLMEFLAKRRFDTYALDLRGCGASYKGDYLWYAAVSLQDYVEDLRAVIAEIQELGYEKIFLIGHSFGGMVAILYAAEYPETLLGLVIFGTPFLECGLPPELLEQLRYTAIAYPVIPCSPELIQPMFFQGSVEPEILEKTTNIVAQEVLPSTAVLQGFTFSYAGKVSEIPEDIPVLLLKAELDPIVLMPDAEDFLNALVSRDKMLLIIKGHGHDLLLEKKPRKVYRVFFLWLLRRVH